jgi:MOSC domain-containing protein YiiM
VLTPAEANLDEIRSSPPDDGSVELIARRPAENERELLDSARVDTTCGLVGDNWLAKLETAGKTPNPDTQLTLMNARAAALFAGAREHWALAGDQLYVDLDLSNANLPPGTRLTVGDAVIEVTAVPHTGCGKFLRRFGLDAQKLANSKVGRELNLRGINARVLRPGTVRVGDRLTKLA